MPSVGPLLSEFRKRSRLSQLQLSLMADVSSRHISFIETGRSSPSREMLLRLADVLGLPHKDCNLLLNSAGYAAAYTELDIDSDEMSPIRDALEMVLRNHEPYPALVMDGCYNLLMGNHAQQALMASLTHGLLEPPTTNLVEALFRDDMFRPVVANWSDVAGHMLRRLRKQVLAYSNPAHRELYNTLLGLQPPDGWQQPRDGQGDGPMLTLELRRGPITLSVFTTISQFGTALDTGVEELLIESYFPANEETRQFFRTLVQ